MPQLHSYVPETVATALRRRAKSRGLSVSRYVASIVEREVHPGWPEGFFEEVIGGWKRPPLRRPPQGEPDAREPLYYQPRTSSLGAKVRASARNGSHRRDAEDAEDAEEGEEIGMGLPSPLPAVLRDLCVLRASAVNVFRRSVAAEPR